MANRIREWWAQWRKRRAAPPAPAADLTPHVALFPTPATFRPDALKVDLYPGLLFAEVLGGAPGEQGSLLTVWRDRRAYEAVAGRFLGETGLGRAVPWEGFYLGLRQPGKRWWQSLTPTTIWAGVATLFLGLGYLHALQDASGWFIGSPELQPTTPPTLNVMVGDPVEFKVSERNIRPLGECLVEFRERSVDKGDGLSLDPFQGLTHPAVKPDGEAVLEVKGKALQEGDYTVAVKGRARAGFIPLEKKFDLAVAVRVWRELVFGPRRVKTTTADGKLCEVEFELRPGRRFAAGLEIEAVLNRVPGVRFVAVTFPGTEKWAPQNGNQPGKEFATLDWSTPEIVPFRATTVTLMLESTAEKGKTADEWNVVAQGIQVFRN